MATKHDSGNASANTLPPADKAAELANLSAAASQHYAQKKYDAAAELYSQATALQAELNGEMKSENADLLYAYGRCLFQLGVSKSDVLGGKVAGDASQQGKQASKKRKRAPDTAVTSAAASSSAEGATAPAEPPAVQSKDGMESDMSNDKPQPFFQISGDGEEWDDDSDEDKQEEGDGSDEEDDLATAYEILDLARILFNKRLEETSPSTDNSISVKEHLADVYDLQAEISLENERFRDAISDSKASLELKKELYPPEKGIIAEAHFKLSLALEFASVTIEKGGDKTIESESDTETQVDESLRLSAAKEMEAAIDCTKLRLAKLEEAIGGSAEGEKKASPKDVEEIKEIISDMEQRHQDLKNPAISVNNAMGPAGVASDENPLGGILGSILGETPAAQKARIDEASKDAKDVSGLVRRKQPKKDAPAQKAVPSSTGPNKRKVEALGEPEPGEKRAKTEERDPESASG